MIIRPLLDLFLFVAGIKLGDMAGRKRLLTKKRLRRNWLKLTGGYGPWSIGVLEGPDPFGLVDPGPSLNPVFTGAQVTDVDALFVADPFVIKRGEEFFMFFEIMKRKEERGCIGAAVSQDGKDWSYLGVVLEEDFHLSFPCVFKWKDKIFMVPESSDDWSVRLYEAEGFPGRWRHVGNLLAGYQFKDPTIFRHKGLWWLFVSAGKNEITNLYFSEKLFGNWTAHAQNPVVRLDKKRARSAGRILEYKGKIFRLAQDNSKRYGRQVLAWEITSLSPSSYRERLAVPRPLVTASGRGWNRAGMHTLNSVKVGETWLGLVDGRRF